MKRTLLVALVGSFVLLAGCSGSSGDGQVPASDSTFTAPGLARAPESSGAARGQAPDHMDRKEVVAGQVYITVDDPIRAARDAIDILESAGGRADNWTENPETDNATASSSITARIPADALTGTLDRIEGLGKVTSVSITRDDVTTAYADLDARTAALAASVDRLKALIAGAVTTADLLEAESALSSRQGELDSLTSQKNYLADQVDLSTVTVQFSTEDLTPSPGPENFWDGIVAGWNSLVDTGRNALVALGRAIPWLGTLTVGALVVYVIIRIVRRGTTERGEPAEDVEDEKST